ETALKTSVIANLVIFGVALMVAIAAITVSIIFCPPVGIALVCVGASFCLIALGAFNMTNIMAASHQAEMAASSAEGAQERIAILGTYHQLFQDYPNQGDKTSFEELLDRYPPGKNGYLMSDLETYVKIFEKETFMRLKDTRKTLKKELHDLQEKKKAL